MVEKNESEHFVLPPPVLYALLAAFGFGGGGLYGVVGPQLEKAAIQACYDNSQIAINVAAQHGEELTGIRAYVAGVDRKVTEQGIRGWTTKQQNSHESEQEKRINRLERELDWLRKQVEK